jgi:antitoxin component YwqK of YwqJK toxin-antitoxin module
MTRTDVEKPQIIRETFTDRNPDNISSNIGLSTIKKIRGPDGDSLGSDGGSELVGNLRASELNITVFNCSEIGDCYEEAWHGLNDDKGEGFFSEMEENPYTMHPMIKRIRDENTNRLYKQNGELKYSGETTVDGVYEGLGKEFDILGALVREGYYKNGVLHGNWARIYQKSDQGLFAKEKTYLVYEGSMIDGSEHGEGKEFYPSGKVFYEGSYFEGTRCCQNGKLFYEKGIPKYQGGFNESVYHGLGILYYPNGKVQYKGGFEMGKFCDKAGQWQNHTEDVIYRGGFRDGSYCGKGKILIKGTNSVLESIFFNGVSLWDRKIMIRRDNGVDKDCCLSLANDEADATYSKHSVWVTDKGKSGLIGKGDKYKTINMVYKFGYLSRAVLLTLLEHICLAQCKFFLFLMSKRYFRVRE